jgi:hypothetical protein
MDRLRVLAETDGFFTRTDALAVGHDDRSITRALRLRAWLRVRPGAYTYPDLWPVSRESQHRLTALAVHSKLGPNVALSHTTSALMEGLRLWGAPLEHVHVTRRDSGAPRVECGVVHHVGAVSTQDLVEDGGVVRTRAARAAIETASLVSLESAVVTLDSALQLRRCTREDLEVAYQHMEQWPGMRRVRLAVRLAAEGAESVGESRARYLFYSRGVPAPKLQHHVFHASGRLAGITDFAWPDLGLLGEFDGRIKYGRLLREDEDPGEAVYREKKREDLLRELTDWRFVRLVWADLYRPAETAARVRRQLRAAA